MRRVRLALLLAALGVFALLGAALALHWLRPAPTVPAWADDYDVSAAEPETIAPGTVIGESAPAGWSHLVIKSQPRLKPSEVDRLPDNLLVGRKGLVRMVSWMFTAFTADVVQERQGSHARYRLRAIGLGLGTNVKGRDTVLTAETAGQFGAELDFIQKEVLTTGYRVQRQARVVIHGPSFALLDTPVTFRCGTKNRLIRFRYALLVDPHTGKLEVFCWRISPEDPGCSDLEHAVLLNPDTVDKAELIPDLTEFNKLGIPNDVAFGVDGLPPHRLELTLPAEIRDLAAQTRFTPGEAHRLEDALRKLLPH